MGRRIRVPHGQGRSFYGVGGFSECEHVADITIDELGESDPFWIAGMSPALTSVGKRCRERGFSFVWPAGWDSIPYLIAPWGTVIPLVVEDNIPYIVPGDPRCRPEPCTSSHLRVPAPPAFDEVACAIPSLPLSSRVSPVYLPLGIPNTLCGSGVGVPSGVASGGVQGSTEKS